MFIKNPPINIPINGTAITVAWDALLAEAEDELLAEVLALLVGACVALLFETSVSGMAEPAVHEVGAFGPVLIELFGSPWQQMRFSGETSLLLLFGMIDPLQQYPWSATPEQVARSTSAIPPRARMLTTRSSFREELYMLQQSYCSLMNVRIDVRVKGKFGGICWAVYLEVAIYMSTRNAS